jgi:hypothetical protein
LADNYSETNNQFAKAILDAQAVVTRRFEVIASTDGPTDAEIAALERALADAKKRRRAA